MLVNNKIKSFQIKDIIFTMGGKDVSEQKPSHNTNTHKMRENHRCCYFSLNRIFLFYKGEKEKRGGTID